MLWVQAPSDQFGSVAQLVEQRKIISIRVLANLQKWSVTANISNGDI